MIDDLVDVIVVLFCMVHVVCLVVAFGWLIALVIVGLACALLALSTYLDDILWAGG